MARCVCCGSRIPDDQGSRTCSYCYGDPDHGKDGLLRRAMEEEAEREWQERQEELQRENEQ